MNRDAKFLEAYAGDLVRCMPDAGFMVDATGRIVVLNELAERMFGYARRELEGKPIAALIPERFRGTHGGHCADYFARPRSRSMGVGLSLYALRKDGIEFPVEISLSPIDTDQGPFVVGAVRDISQAEERYRAVFEYVAVGVVHSDTEGRILNANPRFCAICGYSRAELLARGIADLTHPEDLQQSLEARKRLMAGTRPDYARDARLLCKGGIQRWTHITTSLVRGADRRPLHFISIIHDISGQKLAEEANRESEERFRAMVEQSISGACIIDRAGRFLYLNPRLLEILGHDSDEALVGRRVLEFVAPEGQGIVRNNLIQRIAGEPQRARYHFPAIRKDGSQVTLGAHANLGSYRGEQVLITTVQDVSDLVRAETEVNRYVAKLQRAVEGTIEVVSKIGELRDPYTHGHEHRVGEIATAIAIEMGLSEDRVEGVRIAGYLHDVGKIAVPAEILSKPARLTAPEFDLVKQHAQQSYDILKGIEFPWPVAEAAWQHHERLDGSGYPRGLKGEDIILEARILAVSDTVEAMASHRPYRPGLGIDKALAEIERGRGTVYDPTVANACLRLFRDNGYRIPN